LKFVNSTSSICGGQKDVTISVAQIDRIDEDAVYLKLNKRQVAALPAIPVHRRAV